jgi:hypothetical protein
MKKWTFLAALLLAVSCKVEKTGPNTYQVVTPKLASPSTDSAHPGETGREIKKDVKNLGETIQKEAHEAAQSDVGKEIAHGAKEVGHGLKEGAGKAAVAAGDALKRAGEKTESGTPQDRTATHR